MGGEKNGRREIVKKTSYRSRDEQVDKAAELSSRPAQEVGVGVPARRCRGGLDNTSHARRTTV